MPSRTRSSPDRRSRIEEDTVPVPDVPKKLPTRPAPAPPTRPRIEPELGGTPTAPVVVAVPVFESDEGVVRETDQSQELFFDTLFDDFSLTAQPVYNFFVPGEETDDGPKVASALEDLPRYVFLRWFLPRDFSLSYGVKTKGTKTDITRNERVFNVAGIAFSYSDVFSFSDMRKLWANGYLDVGFIEMKTSDEFTKNARGTVDEELYILSGMRTPLTDLSSNDRGTTPTIPYDPYGSQASAVVDDVDPLASVKLDEPQRKDSRSRIKASMELAMDVLSEDVLKRVVSREAAEVALMLSGMSGQIAMLNAVRDVAPGLFVDAPTVPSPSELPPLEYIGFIIEKYVLGEDGGFHLRDIIEIDDPLKSFYIDPQVAYGQVVRYRMLAVMRWTHEPGVKVIADSKTGVAPAGVTPLLRKQSHVFFSSWSGHASAVVQDLQPPSPPEQIIVRPWSKKRQIQVTWTFPDDSQKDISSFHVYRRTMKGGEFTSQWKRVAGPLPARNGTFFDDVGFFEDRSEGYVYSMVSTSVHAETSTLSEQIFCSINKEYRHEGERPTRQVSQPGATLECHGACSVRPYREVHERVVFKRGLTVYPRTGPSKFVNQDGVFTLRLESLDTGESRDVHLDLTNVNVESRQFLLPPPGRIQSRK